MPPDDEQPATKKDLRELECAMRAWKEEVIRHFDVVAEQLKHDFLGATRDALEALKDHDRDHERRLRGLEQATGIAL